jgi:hypothetical protein
MTLPDELRHVSVHALAYGRVLCGQLHGLPCNWGPGHRFVSAFYPPDHRFITCPTCKEVLERLHLLERPSQFH